MCRWPWGEGWLLGPVQRGAAVAPSFLGGQTCACRSTLAERYGPARRPWNCHLARRCPSHARAMWQAAFCAALRCMSGCVVGAGLSAVSKGERRIALARSHCLQPRGGLGCSVGCVVQSGPYFSPFEKGDLYRNPALLFVLSSGAPWSTKAFPYSTLFPRLLQEATHTDGPSHQGGACVSNVPSRFGRNFYSCELSAIGSPNQA